MGQNNSKHEDPIKVQYFTFTDQNGVNYQINGKDQTAYIIKSTDTNQNIFIPKYIEYDSCKYVITKMSECAFQYNSQIKTITFSEDSCIHSIEKDAFLNASLEELYIPSSVEELKEGWCKGISKLKNVKISSKNNFFKICQNSFIVGKTNTKSDTFDCLIFAHRDIKHAFIPQSIRTIGSLSFTNCKELKKIDFQRNSELASIEDEAFSYSSLESICIPSSVTRIGESVFACCTNLKSVNFSENSKIRKFSKYLFSDSSIEELYIPPSVEELEEGWCKGISNLKNVKISSKNNFLKFAKIHS